MIQICCCGTSVRRCEVLGTTWVAITSCWRSDWLMLAMYAHASIGCVLSCIGIVVVRILDAHNRADWWGSEEIGNGGTEREVSKGLGW